MFWIDIKLTSQWILMYWVLFEIFLGVSQFISQDRRIQSSTKPNFAGDEDWESMKKEKENNIL